MDTLAPAEDSSAFMRHDVLLLGRAHEVLAATHPLLKARGDETGALAQSYALPGALHHFGPAWRLPSRLLAQPLHMHWCVSTLKQHPSLMLWDVSRQTSDEADELDWSLATLTVRLPQAGLVQSMRWQHFDRNATFTDPCPWNQVWDSEDSLQHALEHMLLRSLVWHDQVRPWCRQNTFEAMWSPLAVPPTLEGACRL